MGIFAELEGCTIDFAVELNGLNLGSGYFIINCRHDVQTGLCFGSVFLPMI